MELSKHSALLLPLIPMPPKVYSYIVARDYGFAPNPFYGFCTLATCKPSIRKAARIGEWVVGTGSKDKNRAGHIVYAMCVTEAMSFGEYWYDSRFRDKRPDLRGSWKKAYGDNIYYHDECAKEWFQVDSHHSYGNGKQNLYNITNDTKVDRVLISDDFIYWGGSGPMLPRFHGQSMCHSTQGYRCNFPDEAVEDFVVWLRDFGDSGYCGAPLDWRHP